MTWLASMRSSKSRIGEIRVAVRASKTSLTELFGVGPILACTGDWLQR